MTQWISSVLHFGNSPHTVATIKSDGLLLQVQKVPWPRRTPPYLLTLELRAEQTRQMTRVVEVRGDTPQACSALLAQLLTVARQGLAHGASPVSTVEG